MWSLFCFRVEGNVVCGPGTTTISASDGKFSFRTVVSKHKISSKNLVRDLFDIFLEFCSFGCCCCYWCWWCSAVVVDVVIIVASAVVVIDAAVVFSFVIALVVIVVVLSVIYVCYCYCFWCFYYC